jgi:hypothetical protein
MRLLILNLSLLLLSAPAFAQPSCVNFNAENTEIKLGELVTFTNLSVKNCNECGEGYVAKSYSWTFTGGNPVTSAERGPVDVKYVEIGSFEVQLTISYFNNDPSSKPCIKTMKKTGYVKVVPNKDVELESFEANAYSKTIKLYWTTIYEKSNAFFVIERSNDGVNFSEVAKVKGGGDHSDKTIYSAEDSKPAKGETKYRLSKINNSGKKTVIGNLAIQWYDINEALNISEGEKVLVIVEDAAGTEVYSKVIIKNASSSKIYAVDPSQKIKPGNYMIIGSSKNEIFNKTLVVETN